MTEEDFKQGVALDQDLELEPCKYSYVSRLIAESFAREQITSEQKQRLLTWAYYKFWEDGDI